MDLTKEWRARLGPTMRPGTDDAVIVEVRWERGGNALPYLSITGEVYGREPVRGEKRITISGKSFWLHSCGQVRDAVAETFPAIAPFLRWHLANAKGPMHYRENGIYWAEQLFGVSEWPRRPYDPDPGPCFASTVVLGAVAGDAMPAAPPLLDGDVDKAAGRVLVREHVGAWLDARRDALLAAFHADLARLHRVVGSP